MYNLASHNTTVGTEIRAGFTSFMAMAYIIFTNPAILSAAGVPFTGAVVATCAAAGLMTIIMGLVTNYPLCLAAGMGLNAIVAYTIVLAMGFTWQIAMGVIVLEGLVVLILSATAFRQAVMDAIPASLKQAIGAGIGVFITFIGLQSAHLISPNPATLVSMSDPTHPVALLSIFGLVITITLLANRVYGALLIGIASTALLGMLPIWHLPAGVGTVSEVMAGSAENARWGSLIPLPAAIAELPSDFSTFFAFDLTVMPLTFSITHGIGAGFLSHVAIKAGTGKARSIHPLMWLAAAFFALVFALPGIERVLK